MRKTLILCSFLAMVGCGGSSSSSGACERGIDDCSPDAICADSGGDGFTCTCKPGYTGDGITCDDVDECATPDAVSFTKTDYGSEQDCITAGVCLTRGDQAPIYNAAVEDEPETSCSSYRTSSGTRWALGACSDVSPVDFGPFLSSSFADCDPPSIVDVPSCLELVSEHEFHDITFSSWTQNAQGGGFAYDRAQYNLCGAGGTCTNTPGAYTCDCPEGFAFDGSTCADVDECAASASSCEANETCVNNVGSYVCFACSPGTAWDGTACSDVDECVGVDFVRANFGTEQDWIAPGVIIARQDTGPIYNAVVDPGGPDGGPVPTGTLWALGTCDSVSETDFGSFLSSSFADYSPPSIVGVEGCLALPGEDQLHDITFESFTGSNGGGGFSYRRQAYCGPSASCQNTAGSYECTSD